MIRRHWVFIGATASALLFGGAPVAVAQAPGVLHGFVRQAGSAEPIPMAIVTLSDTVVARTDRTGYFSVRHLPGTRQLRFRALGYSPLDTVLVPGNAPVDVRLRVAPVQLSTVRVQAQSEERPLDVPEVSVQTVTPAQVGRVPVALERDLFRALQAMPGVIASGAYSSRLLVRGGTADQNLFLLDGYPVLHPYHLTGAFSAFHMDAVQDAELWLAVPPARYGGRLASVLDVALREGNRERRTGAASLGIVSSAGVVEGPHPAGAWFVGLRTTYLDVLTNLVGDEIPYRFHDAYAKGYVDVGRSNRISALFFRGRDATWRAQSHRDEFDWQNAVYGLSWRRLLGGRAVYEQRVSHSTFTEVLDAGYSPLQNVEVLTDHDVALSVLRGDLRVTPSARHAIEAGWAVEHRTLGTALRYVTSFDRQLELEVRDTSRVTTTVLYAQDDVRVTDALRLRLGVRGERHPLGSSVQPRVVARWLLSERFALSAGAGALRQYDHLLQDPDVNFDIYAADVWLPGGVRDAPVSRASHVVVGAEARLPGRLRAKAEAYSKRSQGTLVLAPYGAEDPRFAVERVEVTRGLDDGLDLSVFSDPSSRVQGWIGYSLARSARRLGDTTFAADPYPRQRLVAVAEGAFGAWSLSARSELFEGVPYTPGIAIVPQRGYDFGRRQFATCESARLEYLYGDRNSARTGLSKRLDLGAARRWTDRRGWRWELGLSLINTLFDPTGIFRPDRPEFDKGCAQPEPVKRAYEVLLPPIPSVSVRLEF